MIRTRIGYGELGLVYEDGELVRVLETGRHLIVRFRKTVTVEKVDERYGWILCNEIEQLETSGLLRDRALFFQIGDSERAIVRMDGRLDRIVGPGRYGVFTRFREVEIERVDTAEALRLVRRDLTAVLNLASARTFLNVVDVPEDKVGALFTEGRFTEVLPAGRHAFWKDAAKVKVQLVTVREQISDVAGQDIMTQDKVTLRMNAVVGFRITDVEKAVTTSADATQALYRETQLALRAEVGSRSLDSILQDKARLTESVSERVAALAKSYGITVQSFGIRDIILPGDMKTLLNRVIEAQKEAEANAIKRREETAAMRSQLNTAKLMQDNPVLMRLRELEILESVAAKTDLRVVLGEKGLTEQITKLI